MLTSVNKNNIDFSSMKQTNKIELNTQNIIGANKIENTAAATLKYGAVGPNQGTEEIIDLSATVDEEQSQEESAEKKAPWYKRAGATVVVGATSILTGILDIGDELTDGIFHAIASINELLGDKDSAASMRELISYDWGDSLNDILYNPETGVLKDTNDASLLKYDSTAAKWIRNETKLIGEITAATVCPGAASTVLLGFLAGSGNSAEKKYQTTDENGKKVYNKDYEFNLKDELLIDISGVLGSLTWTANRALGKGFVNLGQQIKTNGLPGTISQIWSDVGNLGFFKTAWKNNMKGVTGATNILNTAFEVSPDIMDYATGDKELNAKNVAGTIVKGAKYLALTILLAEAKTYIKKPHYYGNLYNADGSQSEALKKVLDNVKQGNVSSLMNYSKDQQKIIIDEILANSDNPGDDLYKIFSKLGTENAEKLLKNVSGDGRENRIVSELSKNILRHNEGNVQLNNISDYGNFQKYILAKLPASEQADIAKEAAQMYKDGKISEQELRILADPKDTVTQPFLKIFRKQLSKAERAIFDEKFYAADRSHEAGKTVSGIAKPLGKVSKTGAKIITSDSKTKTIHTLYEAIMNALFPDNKGKGKEIKHFTPENINKFANKIGLNANNIPVKSISTIY